MYFSEWCDKPPFHYPFDLWEVIPNPQTEEHGEVLYYLSDSVYRDPEWRSTGEAIIHQRKSAVYRTNYDLDDYEHYAYQFDTGSFNGFLRTLCTERDIALVNDRDQTVESDERDITQVRGVEDPYIAELYIDAAGFSRVLIGSLDADFHEFDIPLDSAWVTQVDRHLADVIPGSGFQTCDAGWMWEIDTFQHRGHWYVCASD